MTIPQSMICKCQRCGHEWVRRIIGRPARCAKCKTPYWNVPAGMLKVGRPVGRKDSVSVRQPKKNKLV